LARGGKPINELSQKAVLTKLHRPNNRGKQGQHIQPSRKSGTGNTKEKNSEKKKKESRRNRRFLGPKLLKKKKKKTTKSKLFRGKKRPNREKEVSRRKEGKPTKRRWAGGGKKGIKP